MTSTYNFTNNKSHISSGRRSTLINKHATQVDKLLSTTTLSLTNTTQLVSKNFFVLNNKMYDVDILKLFLESDKRRVHYHENISLLDLCANLNVFIHHYCYHYDLSIAGNCRMCLVEISNSLKPVASCAFEFAPNLQVLTDSFVVHRAREGITEFLLANHPLDCAICDQGGECDLQDQSLIYGPDRGRLYHPSDFKRAVTSFYAGITIKVILTRCIHCTRCIRFLDEVAGESNLGMLGRGQNSEIGFYIENEITSELSSNLTEFVLLEH